jgi:hypothetical protein
MEEGVTIAKVPDWMVLTPEMMPHLIRAHDNVGRTLSEEKNSHVACISVAVLKLRLLTASCHLLRGSNLLGRHF